MECTLICGDLTVLHVIQVLSVMWPYWSSIVLLKWLDSKWL